MESVQKITCGFESLLADKEKKELAGYMQKIGFSDISAMFYDLTPETGKKVYHSFVNATIYSSLSLLFKTESLFRFPFYIDYGLKRIHSVDTIVFYFLA